MTAPTSGLLLDIGHATLTTAELVRDKPLWAVPAQQPAGTAAAGMARRGFDVAPVTELPIMRYVLREELEQGDDLPVHQFSRPIADADRIAEDEPLGHALELLQERPFVFVVHRQHTTGIVTRADLEQPIIGLLVFGLVLSFEAAVDALLADFDEEDWLSSLSDERRQRVHDLHDERRQANADLDVLRSLNLDDRLSAARKMGLHQTFGFTSKTAFKKWGEQIRVNCRSRGS